MAMYRAPAVQKPTVEALGKIAEDLGFRMTPDELAERRGKCCRPTLFF